MTTATSGVLARFPLLLPVRNSFASYGASAVTRTSDRGHVGRSEKTNFSVERRVERDFWEVEKLQSCSKKKGQKV